MEWEECETSGAQKAEGKRGTWWLLDDIHGWTADLIWGDCAGPVTLARLRASTEEQIKIDVEAVEND